MAHGLEGPRGLGEHLDSTVANTAMNTLVMVRRSRIITVARLLIVVV